MAPGFTHATSRSPAAGTGVSVGAGVLVGNGVLVLVGMAVAVLVGKGVGVGVLVGSGVGVFVGTGVGVGVSVGSGVGVGVGVAVGAAGESTSILIVAVPVPGLEVICMPNDSVEQLLAWLVECKIWLVAGPAPTDVIVHTVLALGDQGIDTPLDASHLVTSRRIGAFVLAFVTVTVALTQPVSTGQAKYCVNAVVSVTVTVVGPYTV
jgi:hypothetical protein